MAAIRAGAHGWARRVARAARGSRTLSFSQILRVDARTVSVPQSPIRVAQLLNDACSNEAGSYLVARGSHGEAVSLLEEVGGSESPKELTFLPFESTDKLAQRSFWISAAYMLSAALDNLYGDAVLTSAPTVTSSMGASPDGTSGYTYEAVQCARPEPIAYGSNLFEAESNVAAALASVFAASHTPKLAKDDVDALEKEMKRLSGAGHDFIVEQVPWDEAWALFARNPLKLDALLQFARAQGIERPNIPIVRMSKTSFVDVAPWSCEDAVLLRRTKPIKATKILGWSAASLPAHWSSIAPEAQQVLLRLRGIAFPSSNDLQQYAAHMAEVEKSDHRALGLTQSLFFAHDSSPGSPFVLAHGMRLIRKVERVIRDLYDVFGYEEVQTPQLYRSSLWKQSGHWDKYREDMFSAQGFKEAASESRSCCDAHDAQSHLFGLKPMNCPGHCVLFSHQPRSYRELPMRVAEFSPLHRNEATGALSGLTRVRRFHQDDAHVFCTPKQVSSEIQSMLRMLALAYGVFGFGNRFELVLSTRPDNYIGEIGVWDAAEASLKEALDKSGRPWSMNEGDGAFYGPKIDIRLVDAMGRKHQTATIQLDFQLPERFQLEYALADPGETRPGIRAGHARPVMIHRAILGSFERFLAILLEQCRGWWPFWLSPRQAVVVPTYSSNEPEVHDRISAYAKQVRDQLSRGAQNGATKPDEPFLSPTMAHHALEVPSRTRFYVELPPHYLQPAGETLGKKVRQAQLGRFNFLVVVGRQEAENGTVSLRIRDERHAPAWHSSVDPAPGAPQAKVQDMWIWVSGV
ncbi:threonine--tRNA ligase [Malassezia obtusa]|uniref:threonine--tRNA ligase n=1 Tax=Malassezia obtusa TaxID=76774 RepID=A0AAF0E0K9_9BASI|nr:threonine--tRNA ligase [Malassezia obtusa]